MLGLRVTRQRENSQCYFFSGGLHLSKFPHGRLHYIHLHHVVLAAHFDWWRPFRRHDISGWGKAIWIIVLILIPYIGVLAYVISQGRGMAERNMQQAQQAREELRRVTGFSAADEIEKLDRLKKVGSISDAEFTRLRTQLLR
jgi:hypothetical protein